MPSVSAVLDSEGNFAVGSLFDATEQKASDTLAAALQQELAEEGEAASVAAAFVAGMVGGETAVTALAGGAGVLAAASAGVAAGEAAATATTAAIASGPAAPVAVAVFAVPIILTSLWGAHGGVGCCGDPPDSSPWPIVNGKAVPPSSVVSAPSILGGGSRLFGFGVGSSQDVTGYETKAQALARAVAQAKSANADGSCSGNGDWPSYPAPARGSFEDYASTMIRTAVDKAELWKCWPLASVNFTKILALAIDSWNATHFGPTESVPIMLGRVPNSSGSPTTDPLTYAVGQAVPPDGSKTVPTGQTSGFTEESIPTWGGATYKVVTLRVNRGAAIPPLNIGPLKMQPPKQAQPAPAPSLQGMTPLHMQPGVVHVAPTAAPQRMTVDLALILGAVGAGVAGPVGAAVGAGLGALAGHFVELPAPPVGPS